MTLVRAMMAGSCSLIGVASRCCPAKHRRFFGALEFGGQCISIGAGWAARDAPTKLVTSMARGIVPGPIIGHWPFNGKEPLIVVGGDEEGRRSLIGHRNRVGRGKSPYPSGKATLLKPNPGGCSTRLGSS
jgi:hypothetical protein